jgi:hypothetical protein
MLEDFRRRHKNEMQALQLQQGEMIEEMRNQLQMAGQDPGQAMQEAERQRVQAGEQRRKTDERLAELTYHNEVREADIFRLTGELERLKAGHSDLSSCLIEKQTEMESLKGLLEITSAENQSCSEALIELQNFFGSHTTPRLILTMLHFRRLYSASSLNHFTDDQHPVDLSIQHIINNRMDAPMDIGTNARFISKIRDQEHDFWQICIESCSVCQKPKFAAADNTTLPHGLNEFLPQFRKSSCCEKPICSACLKQSVVNAIQRDWWHSLDSSQWIRCPVDHCSKGLIMPHEGALEDLLHKLRVPDVASQMKRLYSEDF